MMMWRQRPDGEVRQARDDVTTDRPPARATRTETELERIRADARRFETSAQRDDDARERDRAAELRESAARRAEVALLASDPANNTLRAVVATNVELRDRAMTDRRRAAVDRQHAAEDRLASAAAQRQARIDVLQAQMNGASGVYAREIGYAALRGEIDRCERTGNPFVLTHLVIARPNASDDEVAWDAIVRSVVRSLRNKLRSYDPVVRVGDEAFICGLAGSEPAAAHERVDEIRSAVRHGHPPGSISVGFAALEAGDTLDALLARARADTTPE